MTRTASVDYIQVTVTYTIPGTLDWYTASSGGTAIGSGSPFNPVGVSGSGLPNTNTPGTYTFYAECSTVPGCRTATDFVIEATSVAGTLAKTPNVATVCEGTDVSATLAPGSGGNSTDELEFRTNDGMAWSSWAAYTSGNNISTTGFTGVEIRTRRLGTACTPSSYVEVSWSIEATPVAGALTRSPDLSPLCEGTDVSATLTSGSGGNGTDELEFRTHDGVAWSSWAAYTSGDPIPTSALTGVEVRTRRLGSVCPASSYNTASWTITPEPSLSDAGPDQAVCFPNAATLAANTPATGAGAWSVESGPDTDDNQFDDTSDPATTFTPSAAGVYVLRWTISNAPCNPYTDELTVTVNICNAISGTLTWKGDGSTGVGLANVALSNGDNFGPTAAAGTYTFTASGSSFTITPSKHISTPPSYASLLNGVDVGDVSSIQQHITGLNAITDFYRLVAADCNNSGTITTADAVTARQALLLNPAAIAVLNNTKSWRFVPTTANTAFSNGYTPPGPPYTSVPSFPEVRTLTGVNAAAAGEDFFGIKVGDVNGSGPANPANFTGNSQEPLLWAVEDRVIEAGQTVDAVFSVRNFTDLAAFQMALGFDPQYLRFDNIEIFNMGLSLTEDGNFGRYQVENGELRVAYAEATGATLPAQTPLFRVQFTALSSGERLRDLLSFDTDAMHPMAYTAALTPVPAHLLFTQAVTSVNDPASPKVQLMQNRPNPFAGETVIGFVLPEACDALLRVLDLNGRELWSAGKMYSAGYHEETFRLAEGYAGGVLLFELRTPFGVRTLKMVSARL